MFKVNKYFIVLVFAVYIAAVGTKEKIFFNLLFLMAIMLVIDFIVLMLGKLFVKINLEIEEKEFEVDEEIELNYIIKNKSPFIFPMFYINNKLIFIPPFKTKKAKIIFKKNRRGCYKLGVNSFLQGGVFGFFFINSKYLDDRYINIYPKLIDLSYRLDDTCINTINNSFNDDNKRIKKYEYGEDAKKINWKTSAKKNELYINKEEYEEAIVKILLNFDKKFYSEKNIIEEEEKALSILLSIIDKWIKNNILFKVTIFGNDLEELYVHDETSYRELKHRTLTLNTISSSKDFCKYVNENCTYNDCYKEIIITPKNECLNIIKNNEKILVIEIF